MSLNFVMLVDEDPIDNIINQKIIESNNFADRIQVFQTGQSALEYLAKHAENSDELPDLIFLDINMPIMDGFQFLEEFEKLRDPILEKCKIIMLSSSISPRDIDRAASNRFVKKYLNKPLNSRYLQAITI
ncbi:MAG: response regulator [Bacteroidota bacterium]